MSISFLIKIDVHLKGWFHTGFCFHREENTANYPQQFSGNFYSRISAKYYFLVKSLKLQLPSSFLLIMIKPDHSRHRGLHLPITSIVSSQKCCRFTSTSDRCFEKKRKAWYAIPKSSKNIFHLIHVFILTKII